MQINKKNTLIILSVNFSMRQNGERKLFCFFFVFLNHSKVRKTAHQVFLWGASKLEHVNTFCKNEKYKMIRVWEKKYKTAQVT